MKAGKRFIVFQNKTSVLLLMRFFEKHMYSKLLNACNATRKNIAKRGFLFKFT